MEVDSFIYKVHNIVAQQVHDMVLPCVIGGFHLDKGITLLSNGMGLSAKRKNMSRFLMLLMASLITFISWSSMLPPNDFHPKLGSTPQLW